MSTNSTRWRQIADSLKDKEYRDLFVAEHIDTGVSFQVRAMRQARGWSQRELAGRVGMTQEGVSRLENPDYGRFTITTLKRLASAFDVGLEVRFVPFSQLVDWAAALSPEDLAVPDFEHDPGFERPAAPIPAAQTADFMPPPQREVVGRGRFYTVDDIRDLARQAEASNAGRYSEDFTSRPGDLTLATAR